MRTKYTLLLTLSALLSGGVVAADDATSGIQCELKFRFDSSVLPSNAQELLAPVASRSFAHPDLRIVLDGNTDPIGTAAYNTGLSIRRAEAVRSQLVALGVDDSKIIIAAYGEDGPRRARFADDRRVTVWTTAQSVASVIARTFDGRGTAVKWQKPMTMAQIEMTVPVASR
jgi:outer membrane protein OmpA-like peptidoglycan-associated protein